VTEIPKEDGSKRPLVISCLEDKIVQSAVSEILTVIYEPLFLPCSYGYRAGKSCHDALRALSKATYRHPRGAVVEIDIRQYFNTIPHQELMRLLGKKISDKRFLRLIEVLITAPIGSESNTAGCPQGSIISPILSNIYLHYAIDEWFGAPGKPGTFSWCNSSPRKSEARSLGTESLVCEGNDMY
jgi:RNA-directed DNA polymerase